VNPKGYVPALALDGGQILTENIAILAWVADQAPRLIAPGPLGRYRTLEALAFISTEIHKAFRPFFRGGSDADKAQAAQTIGGRLGYLSERVAGDYLFGAQLSVADAYLFVMLMWAKNQKLEVPAPLTALFARVRERPAVRLALEQEGLA
jgi:glutathione S-transferase